MKILNISSGDEMGARFNGFDIHDALLDRGHQSWLGSFWNQTSSYDWSFNLFPGKTRRLQAEAVRGLEVATGHQSKLQWWSKHLLDLEQFKDSDVVHLQIIHDHLLRLETVSKIIEAKPTVWTWHDLWPVTGHCIQPVECDRWNKGCGSCPDLLAPLPVFVDRTSAEYKRKVNFLSTLNIDVHVTTKWMEEKIRPHIAGTPIKVTVFPFGVDTDVFKPQNKSEIRRKLGIGENTFCVFARATEDPLKGFKELAQALDKLSSKHDLVLLTVQAIGLTEKLTENLKVIELPWTNDPLRLVNLYTACDVFAMPSRGESFGMMALEAMSCGRAVVCVGDTATAEIVNNPALEVSSSNLTHDLEKKIEQLIYDPDLTKKSGDMGRMDALVKYNMDTYLENLTALYKKAVERHSD